MEKILKNEIINEQPNEEDNNISYWKISQTPTNKSLKCTVWRCNKCHPHAKPLTELELRKIRAKISSNSNKVRKLKICKHDWCKFCKNYVTKANLYIAEENNRIREERKIKEMEKTAKIRKSKKNN